MKKTLFLALLFIQCTAHAADLPGIPAFIDEMVAKHHFKREELQQAFSRAEYKPEVIDSITKPAILKPWIEYRPSFINPQRIDGGVQFWQKYAQALKRAEQQYGVPQEIILGILGVETAYGRNPGRFRALDALTTLAFDYPQTKNRDDRMSMFRKQLENFLIWTRERNVDPLSIYGSYAGAVGIPQFMPTSLINYAVDYDGDGKIDLAHSAADAIGSVGNFLMQHGWERDQPVIWHIGSDPGSQGLAQAGADGQAKPHWTLGNFLKAGIEMNEPGLNLAAQSNTPVLVIDLPTPDQPTQYFLGLQNFYVLTRYNRSFFYAMAVYDLAQAIKAAKAP